MNKINYKISVSGLGYVGLPVLVAFSKINEVIGFDINNQRIDELKKGWDKNNEVNKIDLLNKNIKLTNDINDVIEANFHIVAVPMVILLLVILMVELFNKVHLNFGPKMSKT